MYRLFSFVYPRRIRESFTQLLLYSNIKIDPRKFLGFVFIFNILLSLLFGFFLGKFYNVRFWLISIPTFIIFYIAIYLWLIVYADKKAKFVEEVLPDALQLMATNLRSGFTTDRAFLLSARPEFGPLQEEINMVGKEVTAGRPIEEALNDITKRIRSDKLDRSIALIVSGVKSGGRLADLLQQTSNELKNQALVDKKVRSSVNMYVIFIFVATAFGAPLLLGLSTFLVDVLSATLKNIQIPTNVASSFSIPIAIKAVSVSPDFVFKYALLSILTTSILGSFTIGLISKGREKDGIKLLPVLILVSLALFFFVRFAVRNLTGGFFVGH